MLFLFFLTKKHLIVFDSYYEYVQNKYRKSSFQLFCGGNGVFLLTEGRKLVAWSKKVPICQLHKFNRLVVQGPTNKNIIISLLFAEEKISRLLNHYPSREERYAKV